MYHTRADNKVYCQKIPPRSSRPPTSVQFKDTEIARPYGQPYANYSRSCIYMHVDEALLTHDASQPRADRTKCLPEDDIQMLDFMYDNVDYHSLPLPLKHLYKMIEDKRAGAEDVPTKRVKTEQHDEDRNQVQTWKSSQVQRNNGRGKGRYERNERRRTQDKHRGPSGRGASMTHQLSFVTPNLHRRPLNKST